MEYSILGRTGFRVSRMGLGGAPLGGVYGDITDDTVNRMVDEALDLGINFVDTAPRYGESERRLGNALKGKRDRVVLATKAVGEGESFDCEGTIRSVERSLRLLQTDWIDLIQAHDVEQSSFDVVMNGMVPAFLKLKEQGKVRALGVNTRDLPLLMRYMKTDVFDTIQFYTRYTLVDHTAKDVVLPLAQKMNIGVINGSALAMGILAETPASWFGTGTPLLKEAERRIAQLDFLRKPGPHGLVEPALRFSLSCPQISVTMAGPTSVKALRQNASFCDGVGLTESEQNKVLSLFVGQPLFS